MSYKLHVVGLPHISTNVEKYNACAFGSKLYYFCKMMTSLGIECIHYGGPESEVDCEHITVITKDEQNIFCNNDNHSKEMFKIKWDYNEPYWQLANERAAAEIRKRATPQDKVCYVGGACQSPIMNKLSGLQLQHCEPFSGYTGIFTDFVAFECITHAARVYSIQRDSNGNFKDPDGRFFDAIIPVYNDRNNFPLYSHKEDYYAFVGRLIIRKGIRVAVEVANETKTLLRIAGQGVLDYKNDPPNSWLQGEEERYEGNFEYIGTVNEQQRGELMGKAKASIMPTFFLEPGQNTQMETRMCGTPLIGTPWGAAACDTKHGKTSYLCRTKEQFCWAATDGLKYLWTPKAIQEDAIERHDILNVRYKFKEWFDQLDTLYLQENNGWYAKNPNRKNLKYAGV